MSASARPTALLALLLLAAPALAQDRPATAPPFRAEAGTADSILYRTRVMDNNLMGMTITNYGFIGTNFINRSPSMEYPLGSGMDHLVRGGLWVGARAISDTGEIVRVTTAAVDGSAGSSAQNSTEFTPAGIDVRVKSRLPNSPYFDENAISEQDFISEYSDRPAKSSLNNSEDHFPLNLFVRQSNYAWSFSDYKNFVIFHYVIRNDGRLLRDVYAGVYCELASGNKNAYSGMPPSATGSALGTWYSKKWVAYDADDRLFREHYCANQPIPSSCALGVVPYWAGYRLLGWKASTPADTGQQVTLAAWKYSPGDTSRGLDRQRYALMSAGTIADLSGADFLPTSGDPVELLTVGPFRQINPGDSIAVDFAFVGGPETPDMNNLTDASDILRFSRFAQQAYDRNYVVPVPPPSPKIKIVPHANELDIYWDDSPEFFKDPTSPAPDSLDFEGYRVYLSEDRLNLHRIAQYDIRDTTGFNTGLDSLVVTGGPYEGVYKYVYKVKGLRDGFKYYAAVTAYDQGSVEIESLESGLSQNKALGIPGPAPGDPHGGVTVFPNPYRVEARWDQGQQVRDHYLWFANLPRHCTLRIYTLAGDLVFETDFDGSNYHAEGTIGIIDPTSEKDVRATSLSGSMYGWDLITRQGQATATGLYIYSVVDKDTGKRTLGKFLVIKSDREGLR